MSLLVPDMRYMPPFGRRVQGNYRTYRYRGCTYDITHFSYFYPANTFPYFFPLRYQEGSLRPSGSVEYTAPLRL